MDSILPLKITELFIKLNVRQVLVLVISKIWFLQHYYSPDFIEQLFTETLKIAKNSYKTYNIMYQIKLYC